MIRAEVASPVEAWDIACVASNMRVSDIDEAAAMMAVGPRTAIERSLDLSIEAHAGRWLGAAVCIFGLGIGSIAGGCMRPWLLGTPALLRPAVARAFLRRNRAMVQRWHAQWPILENYVSADNHASLRWLGWLGFAIHPAEPFGPFKKPFHRFDMRR